jgi:hypothetical protein
MSNWEQETRLPLLTSCKQAARLISLSIERKLTLYEGLVMHLHLWLCKTCNLYRDQIGALRRVFIRHQEVLDNTPPASCHCMKASSKQRMKDALKSQ